MLTIAKHLSRQDASEKLASQRNTNGVGGVCHAFRRARGLPTMHSTHRLMEVLEGVLERRYQMGRQTAHEKMVPLRAPPSNTLF